MSRQTFDVSGMQCTGCEDIVRSELESLHGVHRVEADHREGVVAFVADADLVEEVTTTLEDLGYEIESGGA